jgi:chromate transporter
MAHLKEIAQTFFKLGTIAFGGPAAHIAMMEDEIIEKKKWFSRQHFLDLIGVTNLIPGPNSTEMTMHCGYERGGWKGLIVAGSAFILPAVVITCIIAYLYQKYGTLPGADSFLYGIKAAVISVILNAVYKLGKKSLKSTTLAILGLLTIIASLLGYHEILVMFICGLMGIIIYYFQKPGASKLNSLITMPLFFQQIRVEEIKIFLIFLKVGALLYGSGYVLFAFLDAELVAKGLMSRQELMDAIAVGQMTPGPVLSTASFIGWQLGGLKGAILATVGIFVPSFVFVRLINSAVRVIRKSPILSAFLDAVNIAAVGVILAVCIEMGIEVLVEWKSILISVLSIIIVFYYKKVNSAFIIIGGSLLGYLLSFI